jgi:hypothetical protein
MYSVAKGTNPCPYTTPPGPTISFSTIQQTMQTITSSAPTKPTLTPTPKDSALSCKPNDSWNMRLDVATDKAKTFCKAFHNGPLVTGTPGKPHLTAGTSFPDQPNNSSGIGAPFIWTYAFAQNTPSCTSQKPKLVESDCNTAMGHILNDCELPYRITLPLSSHPLLLRLY